MSVQGAINHFPHLFEPPASPTQTALPLDSGVI
jgi:hypothetical protein